LPKRGFSLLEVLLGGILFASLVVFFAGIWGLHARTVGHSRARIIATFIAAQQLENCITAGFRGVDYLAGENWQPQSITTVIRGRPQETLFEWKVEVRNHSDPTLSGMLKAVKVRVRFEEDSRMGGKKEVVYDTMLSDS